MRKRACNPDGSHISDAWLVRGLVWQTVGVRRISLARDISCVVQRSDSGCRYDIARVHDVSTFETLVVSKVNIDT